MEIFNMEMTNVVKFQIGNTSYPTSHLKEIEINC